VPLPPLAHAPPSRVAHLGAGDPLADVLEVPRQVVLGTTSSELRRVGVGGVLTVNGTDLTVGAVVDDRVVAGAELVMSAETAELVGVSTPRALLVRHKLGRDDIEALVADLAPPGVPVRVRTAAETTWLRHGDAVLPQALVKARFGEFAIRTRVGRQVEQDPAWVRRNIVEVDLPLLGRTRCHTAVVVALADALERLESAGMVHAIDVSQFGGCHNPRLIGAGLGVSRHAWGVAIDVNVATNPLGAASTQAPELVEVMHRAGFAWGGEWLHPDAMHFEYVSPPG
jgi:hypothetical protein